MNDFIASINGSKWNVKVLSHNELLFDEKKYNYELLSVCNNSYFLKLNNEIFELTSEKLNNDTFKVLLKGNYFDVTVRTGLQEKAFKLLENSTVSQHHHLDVKAPMPGLIIKIRKEVGEKVEQGDSVIILEAMKMENDLKASSSGIIENIFVAEGLAVEKGAILFSIR